MKNHKKTELMEWEPGKVEGFLGKNLIDLDSGSLKMVRVDPFAVYPSHHHPHKTEYIYVLEGRPKISIGEEVFAGEKGDFFILPKSIMHSIENPNSSGCLLLVGALAHS